MSVAFELFRKLYSSSDHCVYLPLTPGTVTDSYSGLKPEDNFSEATDKAAIKKCEVR